MKSIIVAALLATAASAIDFTTCTTKDCNTCQPTGTVVSSVDDCAGATRYATCNRNGSLTIASCDVAGVSITAPARVSGTCGVWSRSEATDETQATELADGATNLFAVNNCPIMYSDCDANSDCADAECTVKKVAADADSCRIDMRHTICKPDGSLVVKQYPTSACVPGTESTITIPYLGTTARCVDATPFRSNVNLPANIINYCPRTFQVASDLCAGASLTWTSLVADQCNSQQKIVGKCETNGSLSVHVFDDEACTTESGVVLTVPYNAKPTCADTTGSDTIGAGVVNYCQRVPLMFSAAPAATTVVASAVAIVAGIFAALL